MKKTIAVLLALLLLLGAVLCACGNGDETTAAPQTEAEPLPSEPEETTEPEEDVEFVFNGILNASCFTSYMEDFSGEIDGETFEGVHFKATAYQPRTHIKKSAMKALRIYARMKGYDGLRIHSHINQTNNTFMVGDKSLPTEGWSVTDISLGKLLTTTSFWSQSEGETDNYFWFEFINMPVISDLIFTNDVYAFSGEVGGQEFDGFVFKSDQYQPTTWLYDWAIEDIQKYAEENGFNGLRLHVYPIQKDNGYVCCGRYFPLNQWSTIDFSIADMTPETMYFWSQSQGLTENYMWFEFVNSDNLFKPSLTVSGGGPSYANTNPYFTSKSAFGANSFSGSVGGVKFSGFRLQSAEYQPTFYFTQMGIDYIRKQAAASGANIVIIHSYPILFNNGFVVGTEYAANNQWNTAQFALDDLTTKTALWSQSEGLTDVYLWLEYIYLDIPVKVGPIDAKFFEGTNGSAISSVDYKGEAFGEIINGVRVQSIDYQPYFKFTNAGLQEIKKYAEENGYNFLRIHSHATLADNGFILGTAYTAPDEWVTTDVAIEDIDSNFLFWSQSQGASDIFFWFEWYHSDIPNAIGPVSEDFFVGVTDPATGAICSISTSRYRGEAGGKNINGLKLQSSYYQPYFRFSDSAINQIKTYAKENGYNTLILHTYAILADNGFVIGDTYTGPDQWATTEIPLENLDENFKFWSQSQGLTEIYFWFDYKNVAVDPYGRIIHAGSFTGGGVSFEDYQGSAGGQNITGIKITSSVYQPHFYLTQSAIDSVKAYASANGYDTVTMHGYAILLDNAFVINNQIWIGAEWRALTVDINDLSTSFDFWSQSQGTTEIYMWFEFGKSNPDGLPLYSKSFTGAGVSFENYSGSVGGVSFSGIKVNSSEYQPHFHLTDAAAESFKAYAAENGITNVTIHTYAILADNAFVIGNAHWLLNGDWDAVTIPVSELTSALDFWSQSQGTTEIYLWFEYT